MASIEYSNELHFWLDKGTFYYQSGNYEEALIAFNKVISFDAKNAEAWYLRGKSLILLLEIDDGIKSFDNALSIEPNNQNVKKFRNLASEKMYYINTIFSTLDDMIMRGQSVTEKDLKPITSREKYQLYFKHFPKFESLTYYGDLSKPKQKNIIKWDFVLLLHSDFRLYPPQQSLNGNQKDVSIAKKYFDDGFKYEFLGYHEEAIKAIDDGLKIFSNDDNAWNNKAVALSQMEIITEAKSIFDRIILQHPQKIECILNLCWILNQSEKYDEIQQLCDIVIKIDPNNKNAQKIKQITMVNTSIKNKIWWQFWK